MLGLSFLLFIFQGERLWRRGEESSSPTSMVLATVCECCCWSDALLRGVGAE